MNFILTNNKHCTMLKYAMLKCLYRIKADTLQKGQRFYYRADDSDVVKMQGAGEMVYECEGYVWTTYCRAWGGSPRDLRHKYVYVKKLHEGNSLFP